MLIYIRDLEAVQNTLKTFHFLSAHKMFKKMIWPPFYFAGLDATRRGLGTGKRAKQTTKLSNKLPDKSSSQTLSRQRKVAALCGPQLAERDTAKRSITTTAKFRVSG